MTSYKETDIELTPEVESARKIEDSEVLVQQPGKSCNELKSSLSYSLRYVAQYEIYTLKRSNFGSVTSLNPDLLFHPVSCPPIS
jgi:hypothetical protein